MNDQFDLKVTLVMRFQIDAVTALTAAEEWLQTHPNQSWRDLRTLILQDSVVYAGGKLVTRQTETPTLHQSLPYLSGLSDRKAIPQQNQIKPRKVYRGRPYW